MNATIMVVYNKKKGSFTRGDGQKLPTGCVQGTVPISIDDFVTKGKVGFEALHEKLDIYAKLNNVDLKIIIEQLATTGIFRAAHCMRDQRIPRFVAKEIFKMLVDAHACVWEGAGIKKTVDYVMFLRNIVQMNKTMQSVTSGSTRQRYIMPDDVNDMTAIMLQEELRVAEEMEAKKIIIEKLRRLFHAKQAEEREAVQQTKPLKGASQRQHKSDMDLIHEVIEEDKAEYSDMPQKKRKKVER